MELVTPGIGLLFWMLLSFSIVFWIMAKFAWKPIMNMLKERDESIETALKSADKAREQMAQLQSDNERTMAEARRERDQLLKEGRELKEQIIIDAKVQAVAEVEKMMQNARAGIQNEKNAALAEIRSQIATLSVEIAEKLLTKELSSDAKQKSYIDGLINDIKLN